MKISPLKNHILSPGSTFRRSWNEWRIYKYIFMQAMSAFHENASWPNGNINHWNLYKYFDKQNGKFAFVCECNRVGVTIVLAVVATTLLLTLLLVFLLPFTISLFFVMHYGLFWHCKWNIYAKFIRWMVYKYRIACMPSDKGHHERVLHFASHNTSARNIIHLRFKSRKKNTPKTYGEMVIESRSYADVKYSQPKWQPAQTKIIFNRIGEAL